MLIKHELLMFMTLLYGQFYKHMRIKELKLLFISAQTFFRQVLQINFSTINANYFLHHFFISFHGVKELLKLFSSNSTLNSPAEESFRKVINFSSFLFTCLRQSDQWLRNRRWIKNTISSTQMKIRQSCSFRWLRVSDPESLYCWRNKSLWLFK